jgi:hypothetical protein
VHAHGVAIPASARAFVAVPERCVGSLVVCVVISFIRSLASFFVAGSRSLLDNLAAAGVSAAAAKAAAVAPGGTKTTCSSGAMRETEEEDDEEVPEQMEEVVEYLLCGLRDKVGRSLVGRSPHWSET